MKKQFIFLAMTGLLTGCIPLNDRQDETKKLIKKAAKASQKKNQAYEPHIREIDHYKVYRYGAVLKDPFRARGFMVQAEKKSNPKALGADVTSQCLPPQCVPPSPHEKTFLEGFSLNSLLFVGTLMNEKNVALIQTPSDGIVEVTVGGYMGNNNGKVLQIKESSITLQEKILKGGIWKNKKTIIVLNR